jgi:uncharacterized protein YecE (DUF72 family)
MTMARVLVGLPSIQGDIQSYKKRYDMVELHPVDASLPKMTALRAWRKAVPPGFVFSVVLPRAVGTLMPGAALDEALQIALDVATAVQARCIVLPTPPDVRPTGTNRKRLAAVIERVPRAGVVLAWEPRGMWEHDDVLSTARSLEVLPVVDASREALPLGPIVYTRLLALGSGGAISAASIDRVAEQLRGRREVFVVVEGRSDGPRVKTGLDAALARRRTPGGSSFVVRPTPPSIVAEDEEQ